MPGYQQPLGTVSGSSGTPCANSSGDCREVPDVSADADPSTGYVIYDSVNGLGWNALGGTSGAAPLWAAVLAVVASANGNTAGYGALNPALYQLAQKSSGTYLNDVTSGNNDYNATNGGQFPALTGYDMATGLGTPVASQLASGLTGIPLNVAVSGTQTYGGSPTFTASANYAGSGAALRRHPQHQRVQLHHGGHLDPHQPGPDVGVLHPGGPVVQRGDPLGRERSRLLRRLTRAPRTTSRSTRSRSLSPCRARRPTAERPASRAPSAPLGHHGEHVGAQLHPGRCLHHHRPDAEGRGLHPARLHRAAEQPSRAPTPPTTPSCTRVRRTTSPSPPLR